MKISQNVFNLFQTQTSACSTNKLISNVQTPVKTENKIWALKEFLCSKDFIRQTLPNSRAEESGLLSLVVRKIRARAKAEKSKLSCSDMVFMSADVILEFYC